MKILLVSSFLPHPLTSGGNIRLYNLLNYLKDDHEITLVCEKRDHQSEENIREVEKICKEVITVPRKKQWSLETILRTAVSFQPFLLNGHKNEKMKSVIEDLLKKTNFDLIHVETFYVMQNLPLTNIPIVLVDHNAEYLVYKRYMQQAPFILRPVMFIDVLKIKYWEEDFWKKATKLVAVSESEKRLMEKVRSDVDFVPNGVDLNRFKIKDVRLKKNKQKKILFIGDFKWIQNRDSVKFIIKEIWPALESRIKNYELLLWIVGRNIPDSIKSLTNDNRIIFDENAPSETEKIYEQADMLLAPIRVGGGTQYKILEAFASGVPVITTRMGIEGIKAVENEHVLLGKTISEFVDSIEEVLQEDKKVNEMVKKARKLIEEEYDWKKIASQLNEVYQSLKNL